MIKKLFSIFFAVCLLCTGTLKISSQADESLYKSRYGDVRELPYISQCIFSHKKDSADTAEHNILDEHSYAFYAEAGSIVSVYFSHGTSTESGTAGYSNVTAAVYSDSAKLICKASSDSFDGKAHLSFIAGYSGIYHAVFSDRSASEGTFVCDFEISSTDSYKTNTLGSFPSSLGYSPNTHKTEELDKIYTNSMYSESGQYKVSIFEFEHDAGSIFSFKLNTPDTLTPYCVLYTKEADVYTSHNASETDEYACGAAVELDYSGKSYLFVFSSGAFELEADLLLHSDYVTEELTLPYKGELDISDSALMYDSEKIASLMEDFPFSDIKNREIKLFSLTAEQGSVITYLCDRKEHKYFSLVSDKAGLSHNSVYPLRRFGSYCSETNPTAFCYNAYISDSGKAYLCYTGTSTTAYIELRYDLVCKSSVQLEEKYKAGDTLPAITISSLYSDSDIYEYIGLSGKVSEVSKISGYMLEGEDGQRYYYAYESGITAPNEKGSFKLYAVIDSTCTYEGAERKTEEKYYSIFISDIFVKKGLALIIGDDITQAISENPITATVIIIITVVALCSAAVAVTVIIRKKRKTANTAPNLTKADEKDKKPDDDVNKDKK